MTRPRVPETEHGIQDEFNVTAYDQMQKRLRDRGWIETADLLKHGITQGCALEVGPAQATWASSGSSARKARRSKGWISART